jgi:hypothetical protein
MQTERHRSRAYACKARQRRLARQRSLQRIANMTVATLWAADAASAAASCIVCSDTTSADRYISTHAKLKSNTNRAAEGTRQAKHAQTSGTKEPAKANNQSMHHS